MNCVVIYDSITGNTKLLAQEVALVLSAKQEVKLKSITNLQQKDILDASRIYIGFWTDKGTCSEKLKEILHNLEQKEIFLFGTAGFGASKEYFEQIICRISTELSESNTILGFFMCQGKMPLTVRNRYEKMLEQEETSKQAAMLIANFDLALSHPDKSDLEQLRKEVEKLN